MGWKEQIKTPQATLDWLLEYDNPLVRTQALTELLNHSPTDSDVIDARQIAAKSPDVAHILAGQHTDGHWGEPGRYFQKHTGTAWRWLLLHELGFDPLHPQMQLASEFLLDSAFREQTGGFGSQSKIMDPVPCYNGWMLWGLRRSDYSDDPRVQRAYRWVTETMRFDDGDEQVPDPDNGCYGRHTCIRGVVPIVRALAERSLNEHTAETKRILEAGVEFLLLHHVYKRSHNLSKPLNAKITQLTFPGFYWPDFVDVLLVLTQLGIHDPRMEDAITYLLKKQAKDGTWKLQRTYNERSKHDTFPIVVSTGERGKPNKWITLRALVVLKRWFGE